MNISNDMSREEFGEQIGQRRRRLVISVVLLSCGVVLTYFASMFLGAVNISYKDVIDAWMGNGTWANTYIIESIRMPRAACAAIVGAGLSISGMAMQAMFRNPLASPSVLGLSSGAAFGACLAIGLGVGGFVGTFSLPFMAFIFCFITIFLVYSLASTRYGTPTVLLLLAGIAVGTFFSGLSSLVQYMIEKDALASIVYWTMGSFGRCDWTSVLIVSITVGLGAAMIVACSRELNLISMGEEQAKTLGINMRVVRMLLLIGTALAVGGSVAVSGIIGFVGLIIPHVCRAIMGPNHVYLWPVCCLTGAIFLMAMDLASRTIMPSGSIPVGILTALIGAPFFIYIMRKKRNELWG
jgi:iron complex transport system permease protein